MRRCIIAQQEQEVDPEYVRESTKVDNEKVLTHDPTPLLLDALAAIKVISGKIKVLDNRFTNLDKTAQKSQ